MSVLGLFSPLMARLMDPKAMLYLTSLANVIIQFDLLNYAKLLNHNDIQSYQFAVHTHVV